MSAEDPDSKTRRRFLATTGTAAVLGLAGCTGSDDSDEDGDNEQESSPAAEQSSSDSDDTDEEMGGGSVTLLVESVGGGGHDHGEEGQNHQGEAEHDHEEESEEHDHKGGHDHGEEGQNHQGEDGHDHEKEGQNHQGEDGHDHQKEGQNHQGEDGHDHQKEGQNHQGEDGHDHGEEGEDGHDHQEEEHDHDAESKQHSYSQEGLTDSEISHACNHLEEVEEFGAEEVEAGATADESPQLSETHTPYSVSVENEAGYVLFEMEGHSEDKHDHEEGSGKMLTFMTQNGSADVERGTLVYRETDEVTACGPMDRYIVVEPDHGEAVVELSTEM